MRPWLFRRRSWRSAGAREVGAAFAALAGYRFPMCPPRIVDVVASAFVGTDMGVSPSFEREGVSRLFTVLVAVAIVIGGDMLHGPFAHPGFRSGLVGHVVVVSINMV